MQKTLKKRLALATGSLGLCGALFLGGAMGQDNALALSQNAIGISPLNVESSSANIGVEKSSEQQALHPCAHVAIKADLEAQAIYQSVLLQKHDAHCGKQVVLNVQKIAQAPKIRTCILPAKAVQQRQEKQALKASQQAPQTNMQGIQSINPQSITAGEQYPQQIVGGQQGGTARQRQGSGGIAPQQQQNANGQINSARQQIAGGQQINAAQQQVGGQASAAQQAIQPQCGAWQEIEKAGKVELDSIAVKDAMFMEISGEGAFVGELKG